MPECGAVTTYSPSLLNLALYTLEVSEKTCSTSPVATLQMMIEQSNEHVIAISLSELNPAHVVGSECYSRHWWIFHVAVSHIVADPSFADVIKNLPLGLNDAQMTLFMWLRKILILVPKHAS